MAPSTDPWSAESCVPLPLPTMGSTAAHHSRPLHRSPHPLFFFTGERNLHCMMVAKHIDNFSVELRRFIPCHSSLLPTVASSRESGSQSCALGMLLGIFLSRSMSAFFSGDKKKGAEEQLASGSQRGPRGPAAKTNKEAT